jgi:hypothetical protein
MFLFSEAKAHTEQNNRRRKHILILILTGSLCLMSKSVFGQISEGGTPVSFSLDIKCCARTLAAVIRREGVREK